MAGGLAFHPDGRLLVCVAGRGLVAIAAGGQQTWLNQAGDQPLQCLTDVIATPDGNIFLTDGSTRNQPEDWLRDLMEKNHLGRLISCGPALEDAQGSPAAGCIIRMGWDCRPTARPFGLPKAGTTG